MKRARKWRMWALVRASTGFLLATHFTKYAAKCDIPSWGNGIEITRVEVRELKPRKRKGGK